MGPPSARQAPSPSLHSSPLVEVRLLPSEIGVRSAEAQPPVTGGGYQDRGRDSLVDPRSLSRLAICGAW